MTLHGFPEYFITLEEQLMTILNSKMFILGIHSQPSLYTSRNILDTRLSSMIYFYCKPWHEKRLVGGFSLIDSDDGSNMLVHRP